MKYKNQANLILLLISIGFIGVGILSWYNGSSFWSRILLATFEGALVGGIADWFAVTALFKKPLGISYHTEIVPRNREQIIQSVAGMIETELLNLDMILLKIKEISFSDMIYRWYCSSTGKQKINDFSNEIIKQLQQLYIKENIGEVLEKQIKRAAEKWDVTDIVIKTIRNLRKQNEKINIFSFPLNWLIQYIGTPTIRNKIIAGLHDTKDEYTRGVLQKFGFSLLEKTNIINIRDIAEAFHLEIVNLLHRLKNPSEITWNLIQEILNELSDRMESSSDFSRKLEKIKDTFLQDTNWMPVLQPFVKSILEMLDQPSIENENKGNGFLLTTINGYMEALGTEPCIKNQFDRESGFLLCGFLQANQGMLNTLVREVLDSFTDDDLVRLIDRRVGNDLQWIRINGCIVGAFLGLFFYLGIYFLLDPFIRTAVHK